MDRIIKKLELINFQILVFLIPTNLAYGIDKPVATVNGILIDYLLPKIYLSDIFIALLIGLWFLRSLPSLVGTTAQRFNGATKKVSLPDIQYSIFNIHSSKIPLIASLLLLLSLIVSSLTATKPISAIWFLAKILEMLLLLFWIKDNLKSLQTLKTPLVLAVIFQSAVAIIQWIQKKSLMGYLFFGETTLDTSTHIAKSTLGGELRPLPYGTTAHPNILAGFLAITMLILIIYLINSYSRSATNHSTQSKFTNILSTIYNSLKLLVFFSLGLITLLLTQSISAILAFTVGILLLGGRRALKHNLLAFIGIAVALILIASPFADQESVNRRLHLTNISWEMLQNYPLFGIGPNNFTAIMNHYGEVLGYTRFIQPVHNIYFLWLSETGLISTMLLIWLLYLNRSKLYALSSKHLTLLIPFLMVLFIGFFDHYPLSLQTGQLLLTLTLALPLIKSSKT